VGGKARVYPTYSKGATSHCDLIEDLADQGYPAYTDRCSRQRRVCPTNASLIPPARRKRPAMTTRSYRSDDNPKWFAVIARARH